MNKKLIFGVLGAACLGVTTSASAGSSMKNCEPGGSSSSTCATFEWKFDTYNPMSDPEGIQLNATGYHQNTATSTFRQRNLTIYSGDHLSLNYDNDTSDRRESSPYHAFDNNSGYDLVVFEFDKPVTLAQVSMGWWSLDADFSLFAFEPVPPGTAPTGNAPPGSGDFRYSDMGNTVNNVPDSVGWGLIGSFDYDNFAKSDGSGGDYIDLEEVTNNGILQYSSSYWAIGAVMDTVAATGLQYGVIQEGGGWDDRFKIASIAGCYTELPPPPNTEAPEPTSLALMALGIAGGLRLRKRKAARRA
ncbi:MAG: PEP-CTERM sorting domain-containing protein [Gammaproteobacteria bacterium]